ncbi:hypothetical protein J7373_04220 [Xanthomonas sp. A2111]|uniref:ABC transporter permease n=1 Tax=Xanthomonas hawaiiensis TaxID=3003247 RepID=A0ABU2I9E4_9XANT|nr:hypothetical protein [Xanthomonas sp. A2111]MBO9827452.1 hypothetical protein [Xanthomonas sp. A2111]MDS9994460.1 hypothetical protein [Xanthomonas sp. A2111]
MNRLLADLRLLYTASGRTRWIYPWVIAAAFAMTWAYDPPSPLVLACPIVLLLWARLGARLLSLLEQAHRLRLPGLRKHFARLFALAVAGTVLLPVLLYTLRGSDPSLATPTLLLCASGGLLLATAPAWSSTALLCLPPLGFMLHYWVGVPLDAYPRTTMLVVAAACVAGATWAYRRASAPRPDALAPWLRPLWMNLQPRPPGAGTIRQTVQSQSGRLAWMQGIAHPSVPSHLQRAPERAMRFALGPGFAPGSAAGTVLAVVVMPSLVLLWTLLVVGTQSPTLPLILANVMANLSSAKFLQRLWLWRRHGNVGLMESALLPGLGAPGQIGTLFNQVVLKCAIAAMLPWLGLSWLLGLLRHAPAAYYPLTVSITLSGTLLASTVLLACLRWPRSVSALVVAQCTLTLLGAISIGQVGRPGAVPPHWLAPAWSLLLLGMVIVYNLVARQSSRRPHPWLLN